VVERAGVELAAVVLKGSNTQNERKGKYHHHINNKMRNQKTNVSKTSKTGHSLPSNYFGKEKRGRGEP
jgi:hypothetical protein